MAFNFDSATRKPWNNVIFPGNYVAHLNSYRDQGVTALPGYQFFRQVGAVLFAPQIATAEPLDANGQVAVGDYDVKILSPDLRQDDKPRLDRALVVPAGAYVYRTAVNVVNLAGAGSETVAVKGVTPVATLTAVSGEFPESGDFSAVQQLLDGPTALGADTPVQATVGVGALTPTPYCGGGTGSSKADPTAGQSAILVEVCFYMDAAGPDADDVHLPYPIEAGQTTN